MDTKILIRKMYSQDIEGVTNILRSYVSFSKSTEERSKDLQSNGHSYVAVAGNKVVGFITMVDEGEITLLCVDQEFRGIGLATNLVSTLVSELNRPLRAVGWATPHGWEAEGIFKKFGFVESSRSKDWEKDCKSDSYCPYYTGQCNCSSIHVKLL